MSTAAPPAGAAPTITARNLTKRFGAVSAIEDVSFDVLPGRVTGFAGPNGAGKTTTLRILLDLVTATSGTARVLGHRYRELSDPIRRVGAVLEATSFHPSRRARAHLQMLALAAGIGGTRVDEVLDLVGLANDAERKVRGYSLGMRQRLELAGALLGDPDVLVLDEPANGLDPQGIAWLRELVRYLAGEGKTILVSSHLLGEMSQMADDIVIISEGRVRAQGPLAEILTRYGRPSMRVETPDPARLAEVATAAGFEVHPVGPAQFRVEGASAEVLGPLLAQHGVVVYELQREHSDLETVFFSLTTSPTPHGSHGGAPPAPGPWGAGAPGPAGYPSEVVPSGPAAGAPPGPPEGTS